MARKRESLSRQLGNRRYKNLFILAVEGAISEPEYFDLFNSKTAVVRVKCLKTKHSAPLKVLEQMLKHLAKEKLRKNDEAWIVIDRDQWEEEDLKKIQTWKEKNSKHGFALSNPNFEYWLLLHFEDGNGVSNEKDCQKRLRRHLPAYDKHIDKSKFTHSTASKAIGRAKRKDTPPREDWPRSTGTTVYKLIENLLKKEKKGS